MSKYSMLYKGIVGKKVLFIKCNIYTLYITNHQLSYNTVSLCVCVYIFYRDSDISSSVGPLKARLHDYDPGMESGDDLEEEDFSS